MGAAFLNSLDGKVGLTGPVGRVRGRMRYQAFQAQEDLLAPARMAAGMANAALSRGPPWLRRLPPFAQASAAWEMLSRAELTHRRRPFALTSVRIEGEDTPITEEIVASTAFCDLVRFRKASNPDQPRVLLLAPLSGHFATLLRGTVEAMLPDNDVYITDWRNARDAPLDAGVFGFDEYVEYVIAFLETIGPGAHLMAVCQPCAQAVAAVAIMAEDDHPATPLSLTLMAGPVDTRINPTKVNELATSRSIDWFEKELICTVPGRYPGAGRRVYPGFLQMAAFVAMNAERHLDAHIELYGHLAAGRTEDAETTKAFYDEYFAVLDMTAEFYLETVSRVFQDHLLARGELIWRNRRVDPSAIRRTTLFTVEGERDDICAAGQTLAAHDLCSNIFANRKRHHLQPGVGHYGVFSGRRWTNQIYPLVRNVIQAAG